MKVFSFCLYGTEPNYYTGLLENIKLIREWFPEFDIFVYKGICDPSWKITDATVIETGREGAINMLYRYMPLKTEEVGFVRDADSRITERDRWCIQDFLASPQNYHMIRDHAWHRSPIMGGLFGWKKPLDIEIDTSRDAGYGSDEDYLSNFVYPKILPELLVHTNMRGLVRETTRRIPPMKDATDFVGNVIWNGKPKFESKPDVIELMKFAQKHDQFELMAYFAEQISPMEIPYEKRSEFFDSAYIAHYYLGNNKKAQYWLSQFEFAEITPHVQANANCLLRKLGKIVACFDTSREPKDNEVIVYYGNYPDWHRALPVSNRIYRHASRFFEISHDEVDYHPSWEPVGILYVLNLEERVDRYYDTLLALAAVKAPLHRVCHYKAKKDGLPAYVGATKNHVDTLRHFCGSTSANIGLVLADDFVFIDDKELVWSSLSALWKENITYNLCLLSLSKYGERRPYNDVVFETKQPCTTSSGYLIQKSTAPVVFETAAEGLQRMHETGDHVTYCIDRYWTKLPHLYCVRPKIGFQRPSYSNILRTVSAHLD
jgi:hypothetical protein